MSRVKRSVNRRLRSRFRRVPQIEKLEVRVAAGDLLVGLGSAVVAAQAGVGVGENAVGNGLRESSFRGGGAVPLSTWTAGLPARNEGLDRSSIRKRPLPTACRRTQAKIPPDRRQVRPLRKDSKSLPG
jgi:hypothetical protein